MRASFVAALLPVALLWSPAVDAAAAATRAARTGFAGPPSFRGLGFVDGRCVFAKAVSADGSTIVGYAQAANKSRRAVKWTDADGWRELDAPDSRRESEALAVSGDGSVVVGRVLIGKGVSRAFRWTAASGMREVADGVATAVTMDGAALAGEAGDGGAFRSAGGEPPQELSEQASIAKGISMDGLIVAGFLRANSGAAPRAFRWSAANGLRELFLAGGADAMAEAISADGSVVVGQMRDAESGGAWQAFRWTEQGGSLNLRTLGGRMSAALAASADGSVIVGRAECGESVDRAFRWTVRRKAMQDLRTELTAQGVSGLQNWVLVAATGVSADGSVITGFGRNPEGKWESFRAVLPAQR